MAELSPLIEGVVRNAMAGETDMEFVGSYPDRSSALSALSRRAADVAIVRADALGSTAHYQAALRCYPGVKLLGMAGQAEALFELRLLVVDPGVEAFLEAIRGVAAETAADPLPETES